METLKYKSLNRKKNNHPQPNQELAHLAKSNKMHKNWNLQLKKSTPKPSIAKENDLINSKQQKPMSENQLNRTQNPHYSPKNLSHYKKAIKFIKRKTSKEVKNQVTNQIKIKTLNFTQLCASSIFCHTTFWSTRII